jgi:AcrR family transcriptional regulator
MDAALQCFLTHGYENTSMDLIAREAGVSKRTVYSHFPSKEVLFDVVLRFRCAGIAGHDPCAWPLEGSEPREVLANFASHLMRIILSPDGRSLMVAVLGAADRFPDLSRTFWNAGPRHSIERLTGYFESLKGDPRYRIGDPTAMTMMFIGMVKGPYYIPLLLRLIPEPTEDDLIAHIAVCVETFVSGQLLTLAPDADHPG